MNIAIILAGGSGDRMGSMNQPKQFIDIYGKPIVIHTLEIFDIHPEIDQIVVCCKENYIDDLKIMIRRFSLDKVKNIVGGGSTRKDSVFNGLSCIKDIAKKDSVVLIHDSVRPLVTGKIISENIKMAKKCGAADTVVPAGDTIVKSLDQKYLDSILTRSEIFIGQTPQSFLYETIYEAHLNNKEENPTDDCRLVLNNGGRVGLVYGDNLNFKITTQADLTLLKAIVKLGKLERI